MPSSSPFFALSGTADASHVICVQAAAVVSSPVMLHTASTSVYPSSQLGVHLSPAGSEAEQLPSSSPFFALSGTADASHVICVQAAAVVSSPVMLHTASTSVYPSSQLGVHLSPAGSEAEQLPSSSPFFALSGTADASHVICVQAAAVVSSPVMLHTASTSVYPSSQLGVHLSPAGSEAEQLPSSSPFFALSGTADALHVICVQAAAAVSLPSVPHTASTSVYPSLQSGVQVSSAFSVFTQVSAPTVSFMFDGALASEAGHSRRHCGAVSTPASLHCAGVGVYPSLQLGVHDVPACSTSSGQSPLPFEFSGREKAHVFPSGAGAPATQFGSSVRTPAVLH